jgi:hypothetical protein
MLPLITLSYAPKARTAAVIGFGSGMSSHLLLASPALRNLVTVEIEPQMIAGARIFYPANRRAYEDPRSHIMIDDAKSYFASTARRYDLIMSEPSNPWVSGVSGLFTEEFYGRVRQYLSDDGVFGQWLHLYELDDELVLSVLGALHRNFRSYEIYLVASNDLLIVASNQKRLPEPDWSVIDLPAIRRDLCHFRPLDVEALEALHLAGRRELGPLLGSIPLPNSDYFPTLDLGAERRRFRRDVATGFPALSLEWFGLLSAMRDHRVAPSARTVAAVPENPRARARAIGALLRSRAAVEPVADTAVPPGGAQAVFQWRQWSEGVGHRPTDWVLWADQVHQMERLRNDGTAGVADTPFYGEVRRTLEQFQAPRAVRDLVAFRESLATWNFGAAAEAADRLLPVAMADHRWITADELRDGAVFAKLRSGDVQGARAVLDRLARFSVRGPGDLRNQLLAAYVRSAEFQRAMGLSRPKSLTER